MELGNPHTEWDLNVIYYRNMTNPTASVHFWVKLSVNRDPIRNCASENMFWFSQDHAKKKCFIKSVKTLVILVDIPSHL